MDQLATYILDHGFHAYIAYGRLYAVYQGTITELPATISAVRRWLGY